MDIAEIKDLLSTQSKAFSEFAGNVKGLIEQERNEREELEAKMNRLFAGGGIGGSGKHQDHAAEYKALTKFIREKGDVSEFKSLNVSGNPDGGYFVSPVFSDGMTTRLYDLSPMRRLCRVETIEAGDAFEEIDDRDEADATWVGEKQSRPKTATPDVGKWTVPVREIYSLQPVTQRLLDDTSRDLGSWIVTKITDKFSRSEGTAFATGFGQLTPRGFLTYPQVMDGDFQRDRGALQYVKTGDANGFPASNPADVLRTLMWTLRAPYRAGAVWQMNSNTASAIDKFKNAQGDYIWRDGQTSGAPPSLLGYPVEMNEDMPDLAAGNCPIAFGNFKLGYCIVDKKGVKLLNDPYTDKPNVLFYAYRRVGGGLANDDAIKLLKVAA